MNTTGNAELDAVLRRYRRTQQKRAMRFAVLEWVLKVSYHDTEEAARAAVTRVTLKRRAGVVDRQTGETWARKAEYRSVMNTLRHQERTAPERFRRAGVLGQLLRLPRKWRP